MSNQRTASDDVCEMVLDLLKVEADMDGVATISETYMGEKLGLHRRTTAIAVSTLIDKGKLKHAGFTGNRIRAVQIVDF